MKKLLVLLTLGIVVMFSFPAGSAELEPIKSRIEAMITFSDNGTTLQVNGVGTGFKPNKVYVSLLYDIDSVATGPNACLPSDTSDQTIDQMFIGAWEVDESGNGTLMATKTGISYVALTDIGTVSVRLDRKPGEPLPSEADPQRFRLKACGVVSP